MRAKDYRLLAAALKQAKENLPNETTATPNQRAWQADGFEAAVFAIADAINDAEPKFDRVMFLKAAGYDVLEGETT